jgi:hypothetical protein
VSLISGGLIMMLMVMMDEYLIRAFTDDIR